MLIITFNGDCYLLSGGVRSHIHNPNQLDQLRAAGIPEVQGDHPWAAAFPLGTTAP